MVNHLYYDIVGIVNLLVKNDLISREKAEELIKNLSSQSKVSRDYVQYLPTLRIPKKDRANQFVEEADILSVIAKERGLDFHRLDPLKMDIEVVTKSYPATFAKKRLAIPYKWHGDTLEVVCYDPSDPYLVMDLERVTKAKIKLSLATKSDIEKIIQEFYEFKRSIKAAENILQPNEVDLGNLEQYVNISPDDKNSERHINIAVDHLFKYAIEQRASDIHFEPKRNLAIIRFRIDGLLHTVYKIPKVVNDAICSRIKVLARMDPAEKRRPQDGRIKLAYKDDEIEVRASTVPCAFGEKLVLRLQSPDVMFRDLSELGFSDSDLKKYQYLIRKPHGIILITGPTGSGKSTTLYSTLRHINSPHINIISIEDPVEMIHEDFNQIPVQPQIDVTFSTILRNILRQDPDVIMIGEIRDVETAKYAIQCALTGHLVFSTLHTNDAPSAIIRMRDLGVESYLLSSTLIGVVAQRLVRIICDNCKYDYAFPSDVFKENGIRVDEDHVIIAKGMGCQKCRNTGYFGRIGIYEVLPISEKMMELIHSNKDLLSIKTLAIHEGMTTMLQDGLTKVLKKITTLDEVFRAISL